MCAWRTARAFRCGHPQPQERRHEAHRRTDASHARAAQRLQRDGGRRRGHELGLSADAIRKGLSAFGGVKRRFTLTGEWNGVKIYDDYGHHPVEIKAVLKAARESCSGRVIAIAQPHRFTRLRDLCRRFCVLLQRCRHGDRGARLYAGEDADRGGDVGSAGGAHSGWRPPRRAGHYGT
jgi:hypothetical protein